MDSEKSAEINNKYHINDLIEYANHIETLAISSDDAEGNDEVVFNDSVIHASLIMSCILRNSKDISMYCGKFSVFREGFNKKIKEMLDDSTNDPYRNTDEYKNFDPYKKSLEELVNFLQRGGMMRVILVENPLELKKEPIWGQIEQYVKSGNLVFYQQNKDSGKLAHFIIGGDRYYRIENNQTERTALCSFYDKNTVATLAKGFSIIKENSKLIDFN